jgi:hypothetical protein
MEVVENQQLDEAEAPVRKRGGISAPEGERSIGGEANRRNKDYWASVVGKNRDRGAGNKAKRRAAALNKEDVDIYDIILSHLLDEGYAETPEAAEVIMVNMSEEWRDGIIGESRWGSRGGYREPIGQSDSRRLGRDPRYGSLSDSDQAAAKKREDSAVEAAKRRLRRNLERESARKRS